MTDSLRKVKALNKIIGLRPKAVGVKPKLGLVDPKTLWIEDSYQRNAEEAKSSRNQIRQIVNHFNWAHFKTPICVRLNDKKLVVIDGQHTAIAAATHGGIQQIPVMVVDAYTLADRAKAFVSHNKNRISLTPMHVFFAAVAAKDELAIEVEAGCHRAGVRILKNPPGAQYWKQGDTVAVGILQAIARKEKARGVTRILKILMMAHRCPIMAAEIAAVHAIMYEFKIGTDDAKVAKAINSKSPNNWSILAMKEQEKNPQLSQRQSLAVVWMKELGIKNWSESRR